MNKNRLGAPKRVLLADPMRTRGGEERIVIELARGLTVRGYEVALACDPDGPLLGELDSSVPIFGVDYYGGDWAATRETSKAIHSWQPDIVHCHGTRPGISARLAAVMARRKVLWTVHLHPLWGPTLKGSCAARFLFRAALLAMRPFTAATTCVSVGLSKEMTAFAKPIRLRCSVIHNAVDTKEYCPSPELGLSFRKQQGLRPDHLIAVMIARLTPRKGIDLFLRALANTRDPNVVAIIAGEGDDRDRLESLVRELNLAERVTLLGEVTDTRPLMAAADVGLLPSSAEGLPLCVMEMLACGLPVAVSDIPEHQAFQAVGPAVSFIGVDSVQSMTELLDRGINWRNPSLRNGARTGAVSYFDLDPMVDNYVNIYEECFRK